MKLAYQNKAANDQLVTNAELMAEIKSTNLGRKREIFNNIIERNISNIIKENVDSLNEEAISGDKITSRITLKRRRLKQQTNYTNKSDKLIKRNENENNGINESKQQQQQQHYLCQFSPFSLFSHQSNTVRNCPSYNQPISDSKVVASCCCSSRSCCCSTTCSNEYTTNMGTFRSSPTKPVLSSSQHIEQKDEEEEKCTEKRFIEANKSLIRNKKQDNLKLMFKKEPKFTSSSVFILFSIISILFSKQNTQRCDIGRCKSSQFIMEAVAAATGTATTTSITTTTTAKLDIKQTFRVRPLESVSAREGESILLRCEIDNQQGDVQWTKDDELLFHSNGKAAAPRDYPKHSMVGDMTKGEHILEIEKARLKDSGIYRCQVPPVIDTGNPEDYLIASSNVTIHKWPSQIQLASDTKQVQNSTPALPSSSIYKGLNGSLDSDESSIAVSGKAVYGSATASQLQARDIPSSSKLPSGINHITGPSSFQTNNNNNFITPYASTATVTRSSTNYLQSLNLIITWPILLLIIAVVLSLANIYLIYSLVQRHKRQKEGFSQQTDNSLESGSNGGCSATGSAGTGSSRLGTNELSGCELEQLQQNLQNYQQQQHEVQQQQQQQQQQLQQQEQLQQEQQAPPQQPYSTHLHPHPHPLHYQQQLQNHHTWNGQFLAIQSNGWVLEI